MSTHNCGMVEEIRIGGWKILENLIAGWGGGNFNRHVKNEYKEAEMFWVAITFLKTKNVLIKCILLDINIK